MSPVLKELNFNNTILYVFKNPQFFEEALCHRSSLGDYDKQKKLKTYERLEFLGDAIIDAALSHLLFSRFAQAPEGILSKKRAFLVSEASFAQKAIDCDLPAYIKVGKSLKPGSTNSRLHPSICADVFEAVMGAIYLESNLETVSKILEMIFDAELSELEFDLPFGSDAKTELQEIIQAKCQKVPEYRLLSESGSSHSPIFKMGLFLDEKKLGEGEGTSKKSATVQAASNVLSLLRQKGLDQTPWVNTLVQPHSFSPESKI